MKLKSVYVTDGVNKVSGKGQGTSTAHPGDTFETDAKTGARLLAEGAAVSIKEDLPDQSNDVPGPEVVVAEVLSAEVPDISSVAQPDNVDDLGLSDDPIE